MSNALELELNRVNISIKDFDEARSYLEIYDEKLDLVICRALLTAAIVAYARPYKKSRGTESTSDVSRIVMNLLTKEQKSLHKKIIALRDKGVAHSDYAKKPTQRVPHSSGVMMWSKIFDVLGEGIDIKLFKELMLAANNACLGRLFTIGHQLEVAEGSPLQRRGGVVSVQNGELSLRLPLNKFLKKS